MDGITAQLTGTVIGTPEIHRTPGGMPWARVSVVVDNTERGAETVVRVSMQGPDVPGLAPQLRQGASVFVRGRLTLRTWKNEGERRTALTLAAKKVEMRKR